MSIETSLTIIPITQLFLAIAIVFVSLAQQHSVHRNTFYPELDAADGDLDIENDTAKSVPPKASFGDMNIFCLHESRAPGECYPISFARGTLFKRAQDDQIKRRRAFYSQFDLWHAHAQMIAQRR